MSRQGWPARKITLSSLLCEKHFVVSLKCSWDLPRKSFPFLYRSISWGFPHQAPTGSHCTAQAYIYQLLSWWWNLGIQTTQRNWTDEVYTYKPICKTQLRSLILPFLYHHCYFPSLFSFWSKGFSLISFLNNSLPLTSLFFCLYPLIPLVIYNSYMISAIKSLKSKIKLPYFRATTLHI